MHYDEFAGTYVASQCVTGKETSFSGFQLFVGESMASLYDTAATLVSKLLVMSNQPGVPALCLDMFMYPDSGRELEMASGLVKALAGFGYGNPFREPYEIAAVRRTAQWLNPENSQGRSFLEWYCELYTCK